MHNEDGENGFHQAVTKHIREFFSPLQGKTLYRNKGPIDLNNKKHYDYGGDLMKTENWNKKGLGNISNCLSEDDGIICRLKNLFYKYKNKDGIIKLVERNKNVIKNENKKDKNDDAIDMYNKNSTFISLSEDIKENNEKVSAAEKTLQNIYIVHYPLYYASLNLFIISFPLFFLYYFTIFFSIFDVFLKYLSTLSR